MTDTEINEAKLRTSFEENKNGCDKKTEEEFEKMVSDLKSYDFNDCFCQYNKYDDTIDIDLFLNDDIHLGVSKFMNMDDEYDVVYNIKYKEQLYGAAFENNWEGFIKDLNSGESFKRAKEYNETILQRKETHR